MTLVRPRAVIFDWDNTLIDSWVCIREAMNATLRHMGHPEWSLEETKRRVALSLRDAFPAMFGDRWPEARDVYYRNFEAIHLDMLRPLDGAAALLEDLAGQDIYLAVVSNKNGRFLRTEAAKLGWDRWFGRLVGATDAEADKPSAAPVHLALAGSNTQAGRDVWFAGDAVVDMQCAVNSGCVPILLRDFPPAPDEFRACPPTRHLQGCNAFATLVRELSVPISHI